MSKYIFKPLLAGFLLISVYSMCQASPGSDTTRIKTYLTYLTKTKVARNSYHPDQLNRAADFIANIFSLYADTVCRQNYYTYKDTMQNVIASFGTENKKRIVIGAHYDVCGDQPGADDNASGVAGLLELAHLLNGQKLHYRIDLVAYSLEEPPYFRTDFMGSYIHARSMHDKKIDVYGMISLEMIGYFRTEKNSQHYPIGIMKVLYGNKADFITLVRKIGSGRFAARFCRKFMQHKSIKTVNFIGPVSIEGIDYSDHLNYWNFGYSALMISDSSFYRNPNYHKNTDSMETLDLGRMKKVIDSVFNTLISM